MFSKKFFLGFAFSLTSFYLLSAEAAFYPTYPRFDVPMHFLGGMAAALFFALYFKKELAGSKPLFIALFLVGAVAFAGIIWEFFEWGLDNIIASRLSWIRLSQFGLNDTLGDIFVDLMGGITVVILYFHNAVSKKTR